MENSKKMIMFPYEDFKEILSKGLKLANLNAYNEKLEIRIDGKFVKETNIIDLLLEKSTNNKYSKEIERYLKTDLYTKKSPVDFKSNKRQINWINLK